MNEYKYKISNKIGEKYLKTSLVKEKANDCEKERLKKNESKKSRW